MAGRNGAPSGYVRAVDVLQLTRELIAIESTTGREGRVGKWVADRLESEGWTVTRQPVAGGDPTMPEPRVNVLAVDEPGVDPQVVLTTHLDTVPPYIPLSEDETYLFGRGTCDAKGIFAAQWVAANRLREEGVKGVALLGVVGEETDSCGAKAVGEILPRARWIIDGEPTDSLLTSAAKGVLAVEVVARGVAGHSAYPERGRSAVHDLVGSLSEVLADELPWEQDFGPTTVNVGTINGGVAGNVLAPEARALLVVRCGTELDRV